MYCVMRKILTDILKRKVLIQFYVRKFWNTLLMIKRLGNINKVLKVNGYLIIFGSFHICPNEAPARLQKIYFYGLKNILERNNFELISAFQWGATFSPVFIFYYSLLRIFFMFSKSRIEKSD